MKRANEALGVAFELPDEPTYAEVLAYDEQAELNRDLPLYARLWLAAKGVVKNWECKTISLDDDLSGKAKPGGAEVVKWVGLEAWMWRKALDEVPKN